MRWMVIAAVLVSTQAYSQCKTYIIGVRKDTLNCTDYNNHKQGKWVVNVAPKYGNPGYSEEGIYVDDKKEGLWRHYSQQGDILAMENYRWGQKDGKCAYFTLSGIEHEESWRATNPDNPYDTIYVPGLDDPDKLYQKIIKIDATTTEHGTWTYYNPETGGIIKTQAFILGQEVDPITNKPIGKAKPVSGIVANPYAGQVPIQLKRRDSTASAHTKPAEVKAYEKKNANKKKVQVRDGATGN